MADKCPYVEECDKGITESYYRLFCISKEEDATWTDCHIYRERHPELKKTPSEWSKESQG